MGAGIGPVGNAVAVDVKVAAEIGPGLERGRCRYLAAVVFAAVVPGERPAQPMVHADVEIHHDEDRRLQPVGEIERRRAEVEGFGGILREQQNVLGVAMGGVGAGDDVGLLRAGRHTG